VLSEIGQNDIIRLKKPHPCGSYEWQVVRMGADIGLVCCQCGRKVMLTRRDLLKRIKLVVKKGNSESQEHG
jgi:hypothetical protein